jgi:hypothetical protein
MRRNLLVSLSLIKYPRAVKVPQGLSGFSEGASSKLIFDAEITKLRAEILLHFEKTNIMLGEQGKLRIERLRPTFFNFIFTFSE